MSVEALAVEPADLFRIYAESECGPDGYPFAWHTVTGVPGDGVKDMVRANAGQRCLRCKHPYTKREGQWSDCDERCEHSGPVRVRDAAGASPEWFHTDLDSVGMTAADARMDEGPNGSTHRWDVQARWRILTVHHLLTGSAGKRNLLWWNLVSLCQRCHLTIQRRVDLNRVYPWPHSEWFRPYAAGWYAFAYLGEHLSRAETLERLDELLALERAT